MDELARLVASDEIRRLACAYALAIDSRDLDTLVALFVGNHLIDFDDDDHARGVVCCKAEVQQGERWLHQAIQYR